MKKLFISIALATIINPLWSSSVIIDDSTQSPWTYQTVKAGVVDGGFGTAGFYTNTTGQIIFALQIQTDGKIVIAGYTGALDWYVGRLNSDGSVDTSFSVK